MEKHLNMQKYKLIKTEVNYLLENEEGVIIASTSLKKEGLSLSIKNCQAIELGYDLDELEQLAQKDIHNLKPINPHPTSFFAGYRRGFQKALEILGDKKFSEDDMKSFARNYYREIRENTSNLLWTQLADKCIEEHIQSLQQTEWDVVIVTKPFVSVSLIIVDFSEDTPVDVLNVKKEVVEEGYALDEDGCLILRKI